MLKDLRGGIIDVVFVVSIQTVSTVFGIFELVYSKPQDTAILQTFYKSVVKTVKHTTHCFDVLFLFFNLFFTIYLLS